MDDDDDECGGCVCFLVLVVGACALVSAASKIDEVLITIFGVIVGLMVLTCVIFWLYDCWYQCGCECYCPTVRLPTINVTLSFQPTPRTRAAIVNSYNMKEKEVVCSICLEEIKQNSKCKKIPGCGHQFHAKCIDTWLEESKTCPNCRLDV